MPDPTPTPDTLRAAAERAVREFDRPGYTSMSLALMSALDALRAALAASPAPTDTPDEPCADCGHPREDHSQGDPPDYSCWHVYVWALGGCDCGSFRPAAVTAPREDGRRCSHRPARNAVERAEEHINHGPGEWWYACPACPHAALAAAAPAVERATPDPDTLAALLPHHDWCTDDGHSQFCGCWPVRLNIARALIAAGVTINETDTP